MQTSEEELKTRKIECRIGELNWIKVPVDWRKAQGIIAEKTETNMGLAWRDYTATCQIGSEPLMVVEGFWIWWCKTHNQPEFFCQKGRLERKIEVLRS